MPPTSQFSPITSSSGDTLSAFNGEADERKLNIHVEGLIFKAPIVDRDQRGAARRRKQVVAKRCALHVWAAAPPRFRDYILALSQRKAAAASSKKSTSGAATSSPGSLICPYTSPRNLLEQEKSQVVTTCWQCRRPLWLPRVQAQCWLIG